VLRRHDQVRRNKESRTEGLTVEALDAADLPIEHGEP
jgi:hypothetical protein